MLAEKKPEELKLRLPPTLLSALSRLADAEDRTLSEYCRMVLSLHAYGHIGRLSASAHRCEGCNGPCEDPQKR